MFNFNPKVGVQTCGIIQTLHEEDLSSGVYGYDIYRGGAAKFGFYYIYIKSC